MEAEDLLFPEALTPAGDFQPVTGPDLLRQTIVHLLSIAPGEWKVRPGFGVGIGQFLKKPLTDSRKQEIIARISAITVPGRIDRIRSVTLTELRDGSMFGLKIHVSVIAQGENVDVKDLIFYRG